MKKVFNVILLLTVTALFIGCVPTVQPSLPIGIGGSINLPPVVTQAPVIDKEYGAKPSNYVQSIRAYFSTKIARGSLSQYKYGEVKRAYKKQGLAYGGEIAWKGWLVETLIATPTRTGRLLTPKPYMVLFSGEQIVEHILGNSHKLLIKVDK